MKLRENGRLFKINIEVISCVIFFIYSVLYRCCSYLCGHVELLRFTGHSSIRGMNLLFYFTNCAMYMIDSKFRGCGRYMVTES